MAAGPEQHPTIARARRGGLRRGGAVAAMAVALLAGLLAVTTTPAGADEAPQIETEIVDQIFPFAASGSFTIVTTGTPTPTVTFEGELPSTLTFNDNGDGSGTFAGIVTLNDPAVEYPVTVRASNSVGTVSASFVIRSNPPMERPPEITAFTAVTFPYGTEASFDVQAIGWPVPTFSLEGAIPNGVQVNNLPSSGYVANGRIRSQSNSPGVFPVTLVATSPTGTARLSFTMTVSGPAVPMRITSPNNASFATESYGSFTITSVGDPLPHHLTVAGPLPEGLVFRSFTDGTATIDGVPAAGTDGNYPLLIVAHDGFGATTDQGFLLTVVGPEPGSPQITSAPDVSVAFGLPGTVTVTAIGDPTPALTLEGSLPSGITFTDNGNGSGTLAGVPLTAGAFPLTLRASNGKVPDAVQTFTFTVRDQQPGAPLFTSPDTATFTALQPGSFTITTSFGAGNIPFIRQSGGNQGPGLELTNNGDGTATLAGTPQFAGTRTITLEARNGIGPDATQTLTITIDPAPATAPVITSADHVELPYGVGTYYPLEATGEPAPTFALSGAVPPGVSLFSFFGPPSLYVDASTAPGTHLLTITASNGTAPDAVQTFTLTITGTANTAPTVSAGVGGTGIEGSAIALDGTVADADGDALVTTWTVVPGPGVHAGASCAFGNAGAVDTTITCTDNGTYTVTLTGSDATAPPVASTATVTVANGPPVLGTLTGPTGSVSTTDVVLISGPVSDPGANDVVGCVVNWGDGTPVSTSTVSAGRCGASHTYASGGTRTISVTATDDDDADSNTQTFTVTATAPPTGGKPVVRVIAPSSTITFGASIPKLNPSYAGLPPGTSLRTKATCTTTARSTSPAGTYPITCSRAADARFAIEYQAGTLTIAKRPVRVTAPSRTLTAGAAVPTSLPPTYSGFAGRQRVPAQPAVCTTAAPTPAVAGSWPVVCRGASDPNHRFTYVAGTITVNKVPTRLATRLLRSTFFHPSATLTRTDTRQPLVGATVVFTTRAGAPLCSAVTNSRGVAECAETAPRFPGTFAAAYAGNARFQPARGNG